MKVENRKSMCVECVLFLVSLSVARAEIVNILTLFFRLYLSNNRYDSYDK